MSLKPQIRAKVTFIAPEQGGRRTPARSGTRSDLKVQGLFTSCIIHGETAEQVFDFGVEYEVVLELLFGDRYKNAIRVGMEVQLNEGSRMVGYGTVEAIVNQ